MQAKISICTFFDMHWLGPEDCPIDCDHASKDSDRPYWLPVDELYDAFDCNVCGAMCMYPYAICPRCKSRMSYLRDLHGELLDRAKWCNQNIWSKQND